MWNDAANFAGLSLTDNERAAFTTYRQQSSEALGLGLQLVASA